MNMREYLLTCLAEECAEVQQEISKALRFGLEDWRPRDETKENNRDKIQREFNDLLAVAEILNDHGILNIDFDQDKSEKKAKVYRYAEYARERRTLID